MYWSGLCTYINSRDISDSENILEITALCVFISDSEKMLETLPCYLCLQQRACYGEK